MLAAHRHSLAGQPSARGGVAVRFDIETVLLMAPVASRCRSRVRFGIRTKWAPLSGPSPTAMAGPEAGRSGVVTPPPNGLGWLS